MTVTKVLDTYVCNQEEVLMSRHTSLPALMVVPVFSLGLGNAFLQDAFAQVVKTTICHIPTKGNEDPKTLTLPAHVAQRCLSIYPNDYTGRYGETKFVIVAVSGTLEEGFALRPNLDFLSEVNEGNPPVLAIFLGKALVRGVKAYLDIKDSNSREFVAAPGQNPINPGLVATGNDNDANISSIYLADRRHGQSAAEVPTSSSRELTCAVSPAPAGPRVGSRVPRSGLPGSPWPAPVRRYLRTANTATMIVSARVPAATTPALILPPE